MAFVKFIPQSEEGVSTVMNRYPDQAKPLFQLAENLLRSGECAFSSDQRELIATYASGVNHSVYCYSTHKATAEALGVDEGLLDDMLDDLANSPVDKRLKPVLRFVRKLTESPSSIAQADVDEIFAAGWDEDCFHYAVMICSLFNMMNRIIEGYGIENVEEYRRLHGRMLAEHGYL